MSTKSADLEVLLSWVPSAQGFLVTMLYNAPGDHDDYRYFTSEPMTFDVDALRQLRNASVDDYGVALGAMLFPEEARHLLDKAVNASADLPVHLRLVVDPKAPETYQAIRWETLCHPRTGARLTTSNRIRFSRFIANMPGSGQPTVLARTSELRALVVVASPRDVSSFISGRVPLAPIDIEAEVTRAGDALAGMDVQVLGGTDRQRPTRGNILDELAKDIQILYLVCHGRIKENRPQLLLEDDEGDADVVDGTTFAADIGALDRVPTIVVLCSCQSAGRGDAHQPDPAAGAGGAADEARMEPDAEQLAALGPALGRAGAAVVVAMQGDITMRTAGLFLPRFFSDLNQDGIPAKAMATARLAIRDRPDWYMPVLYSRLKRGSTWYLPRFGHKEATLFANLHTRIEARHCIPIVGAGIAGEDDVLPSRQVLAKEWVGRRQMPIAEVSRTDLASVAQFVRVEEESGPSLVQDELFFLLRNELRKLHQPKLPDLDWRGLPLATLVSLVGEHRRARSDGTDAYTRVARLDLPVFVTTSWTNLLEDALEEQGKRPFTRYFDWRKSSSDLEWPYLAPEETGDDGGGRGITDVTGPMTAAHAALGYQPETHREKVARMREEAIPEIDGSTFTVDTPLVYHLCGTLQAQRTPVITEDDYFTWLREWMKQVDNGGSIPGYVQTPLIRHSQLFLGYTFDDWEFRMVFQAVKSFQKQRQDSSPNVGVQLEPDTLHVEREAAQAYLESYFDKDKISVYWQTSRDFLGQLDGHRRP